MNSDLKITPIKNAIISTANKTHLLKLAETLKNSKIRILATGNTAKFLMENDFVVTEISDYTGIPEMLGGRVKTLNHRIHAGILARRNLDEPTLTLHGIETIDLVIVNLYPFEKVSSNPDCTENEAIENIDIGGPTLLRGAAKNFESVSAVIDPNDYDKIIDEIEQLGGTTLATRRQLAEKVFSEMAHYDGLIAQYFSKNSESPELFPETYREHYTKKTELRYGENPHQRAAWYRDQSQTGLAHANFLQGKELSFNNLLDSDAAIRCVQDLKQPACVIIKHCTPCGVAQASDQLTAYQRAYDTDPNSAFGGIIAFNSPLNYLTTESILAQQFVEVILAPSISEDVLNLFKAKPNVRVLTYQSPSNSTSLSHYSISGGLLLQETDQRSVQSSELQCVTQRQPTSEEYEDLLFAWHVVKWVKSNAIVYAKNQSTLGIGAGQCSRVFSAEIALLKAKEVGLNVEGAVMASDAFFPFADGIETAIAAGVKAIIQPGGSKNDPQVIEAADRAGIAMVFTGVRHFRH